MTRAVLLALLASVLAAAGVVELWAAGHGRSRRRGRRSRGSGGGVLTLVLARLGRSVGTRRAPEGLTRRLALAGAPPAVRIADVMAVKCGAGVALALVLMPLTAALPGRLRLVALLAAPLAGFLAPDAVLASRIKQRARAMAAELPDVVELLAVAVAAGLSPRRALAEVGRRRRGPLATELRTAAARIELGESQAAALAVLRRRCPVERIGALVAALDRAERHGAALGPALAAIAADARAGRAQSLRDQAARAGPKIQLVVALLLVPAVMLLVGSALAAGLR